MDRSRARHEWIARRWAAVAVPSIVVGALVGVVLWERARTPASACEQDIRSGDAVRGVLRCLVSYAVTQEAHDLAWAAKGQLRTRDVDSAERNAGQLLGGPFYGDAHQILSYVELRRGSGSVAWAHATIALLAYTLAGDDAGRASAAVAVAEAAWRVGDFTASLDAADDALRLARRLRDPAREVAAHRARADALRRMGDTRGATRALASALERSSTSCDKAWAHLKSGMCWMEAQQAGLALRELAAAAEDNRRCRSDDVSTSILFNQVPLLRKRDPAAALAKLDEVEKVEGERFELLLLRGYLAADRGALAEADDYLARADRVEPPDADWPWEVARARAELAELRGEPAAEGHYRRAIAMVAGLRATARARAAYMVASHRGPHDGLIELLARRGRWRDVLAVVLELDAGDMLRATADEVVVRDPVEPEREALPARSAAAPRAGVDEIVAAWRGRDLVIAIAPSPHQLAPGRERAYRLRITNGEVTGEDVGNADEARALAGRLFADPGDHEAARALGRMIVPAGASREALHVLAIGALGKVPLAALRDDAGALVIARRPLVRVLGLQASGPPSRGTGPAIVLADARGDLPSAAIEGVVVAGAVGVDVHAAGPSALVSATRAHLWSARDAALLHIAVHVGDQGRWRALRLIDGEVGPSEIVQHHLAPRIAVLAGCGSAAAQDEEGWGSLAAALLEAGTEVVIATDRSVDDEASLALMRAFYAQHDWRTDPARALARVQQALAAGAARSGNDATQPSVWAAFSVLARPPIVPAGGSPARAARLPESR